MLVKLGKDPRGNLIPSIKAFINECSVVSGPNPHNIGSDLRMESGEPAQILPVFLWNMDED